MTKEQLQKIGLTDEQIEKVFALKGKAFNDLEKEKLSLDEKVEGLEAEKISLEKTIADANEKIDQFKEMDIDSIKQEVQDWEKKYKEAEESKNIEITELKRQNAIESALSSAKAKNIKAVKALLDVNSVIVKDGQVYGLNEQLETIKKENEYLFESDKAVPTITLPTGGGDPITKTWKQMTLTERGELFKKDEKSARQLASADGIKLEE